MPTTEFEAVFTAIANAIRSKNLSLGSALIPLTEFADRIKMIPRADDVGKVVVYATEQTQAQMNTNRLVRLNGFPAFESPPGGTAGITYPIDARFRRAEWQVVSYPPTGTALTNLGYSRVFQVGDKLYLGAQTNSTTLNVINTKTGAISSITGLPSRMHASWFLVGTKLYGYAYGTIGGTPSYSIIIRIDTTNDTALQITLDGGTNRQYDHCVLLGNRLFWGWSGSAVATVIPFINTNDDSVGTVTGLPSRAHGGATSYGATMFATSTKLYISGTAASDSIAVITASGGTAPNYTTWTVSTITGLPSRINDIWCLAGTFLYVGSNTAYPSILRIQTGVAANTTTTLTTASRHNNVFQVVGNKIYVGINDRSSGTASTIIPVINNSAGTISFIENLPNRRYAQFQLVGTKLYVAGPTTATTLVIINTTNDTWSEITGLTSTHTAVAFFHLDGANLYLINSWGFTSPTHLIINTTDDTTRARLQGFPDNWVVGDMMVVPVSRANPEGGLYLSGGTGVMEVDFASVNERPSGAWVMIRPITGLPNPPGASQMFFVNEKVWLAGSQTSTTRITCLTKSLLPIHVGAENNTAPFVYIKY